MVRLQGTHETTEAGAGRESPTLITKGSASAGITKNQKPDQMNNTTGATQGGSESPAIERPTDGRRRWKSVIVKTERENSIMMS